MFLEVSSPGSWWRIWAAHLHQYDQICCGCDMTGSSAHFTRWSAVAQRNKKQKHGLLWIFGQLAASRISSSDTSEDTSLSPQWAQGFTDRSSATHWGTMKQLIIGDNDSNHTASHCRLSGRSTVFYPNHVSRSSDKSFTPLGYLIVAGHYLKNPCFPHFSQRGFLILKL